LVGAGGAGSVVLFILFAQEVLKDQFLWILSGLLAYILYMIAFLVAFNTLVLVVTALRIRGRLAIYRILKPFGGIDRMRYPQI
jgi:hypothetical protein